MLMSSDVGDYSARQGIQWRFIVELAPWMGGFYERLVGITKRVLKKTLGNQCLTEKQLTTILVEAEAVVNSRPLVYVDEDINSSMVLTPSDFLSLNSQHIIPDIVDDSDPDYDAEKKPTTAQQLLETWKRGQKRLGQFWTLWNNEYMLNLRERVQRKPHHHLITHPQVGEVVLIKDKLPSGRWKVGKISELIVGRDQRIRSAKVLIAPHRYLHRPLSLLYPLECPDTSDKGDSQMCNNQGDHSVTTAKITNSNEQKGGAGTPVTSEANYQEPEEEAKENDTCDDIHDDLSATSTTRSKRKATLVARMKIKNWLNPAESFLVGEYHGLRVMSLMGCH